MNAIYFDQIYELLKKNVASVAKDTVTDYETEAKKDGQQALENMKENLGHWAQEVENGAMTAEDLRFLLNSEAGLDEMIALKEAGLAAVQVDKFKDGLINMVIGTVTGLVKI